MKIGEWEDYEKVERDICYLYHELSEYAGINGDLSFGSFYAIPYWEYLNLQDPNMHEDERGFIQNGCLVMLLAMATDIIDGSGTYLADKIEPCIEAVSQIVPEDRNTAALVRTVLLSLEQARKGFARQQHRVELDELEELSVWVNYQYVQGYFQRKADELKIAHGAALPRRPTRHPRTW